MAETSQADKMKCPNCGHQMNHHASKILQANEEETFEFSNYLIEMHSCPHCGTNASRTAQ